MSMTTKPTFERFGDVLVECCGYVLLAVATILGLLAGARGHDRPAHHPRDRGGGRGLDLRSSSPGCRSRGGTIACAWPCSSSGVLVLASILMLRQPLFFVFMISGFFYASYLRPLPLAVVGVGATSILVNSLIIGLPQTTEAWTFYLVIIGVQTVVIGAGRVRGRADHRAERGAPAGARAARGGARSRTPGLHAQLLTQAREAGVLDERQRMAREIHDTIAQGLIGIVTQLEAADQARDRPADRDRHLDNAERLARESLTEARRSVRGVDARGARGRDAAGRHRRRRRANGPR